MWNIATPYILDATLRDGGYLNNWEFSTDQIISVIGDLESLGVDIVEVGYLNDAPSMSIGYTCPADLLSEVRKRVHISKLAGMLSPRTKNPESVLRKRQGLIDMVRIPLDQTTLEAGLFIAECAREFNIMNSLNFISITAYSEKELISIIQYAVSRNVVDCIYLADSRGTITPSELVSLIKKVRTFWNGPLGFHGHDNIGFALENTLIAISAGCTLVDGTVDGVGLGGGNTRLDELICRVFPARASSSRFKALLASISNSISLIEPLEIMHLYKLSGEKNLEQEWVPIIQEKLKGSAATYLKRLPKKRYKDIEEVLL